VSVRRVSRFNGGRTPSLDLHSRKTSLPSGPSPLVRLHRVPSLAVAVFSYLSAIVCITQSPASSISARVPARPSTANFKGSRSQIVSSSLSVPRDLDPLSASKPLHVTRPLDFFFPLQPVLRLLFFLLLQAGDFLLIPLTFTGACCKPSEGPLDLPTDL